MVERSEEQDHIRGVARLGKGARVRDGAFHQAALRFLVPRARDIDQPWRRIEQTDLVTQLGQPEGVRSSSPADVEHDRRRGRRVPENQLTTAGFLEGRPLRKPRLFRRLVVVRLDRGIELRWRSLDHRA